MQTTSTVWFLTLLAGAVTGYLFGRVFSDPAHGLPDHALAYFRAQATRLAVVQHWARSGVASGGAEPWRPILCALALAALTTDDLSEIDHWCTANADKAGDPELENVWRQARGEIQNALRIENFPGDWSAHQATLDARAIEILLCAQKSALDLLRKRRVLNPAEVTA